MSYTYISFVLWNWLLEAMDKRDFAIERSVLQNVFLTRKINPTLVIAVCFAHTEQISRQMCRDVLACGDVRQQYQYDWGKLEHTGGLYGRFGDVASSKHGGRVPQCGYVITPSNLISYVCLLIFICYRGYHQHPLNQALEIVSIFLSRLISFAPRLYPCLDVAVGNSSCNCDKVCTSIARYIEMSGIFFEMQVVH